MENAFFGDPKAQIMKNAEVVRKLLAYLRIVYDNKNGVTAKEVADVFRFGIQENPKPATRRLALFVEQELPGIEAKAAATREVLTDTVKVFPHCCPNDCYKRVRDLLTNSSCVPLLTGPLSFWEQLYNTILARTTKPVLTFGDPKGK